MAARLSLVTVQPQAAWFQIVADLVTGRPVGLHARQEDASVAQALSDVLGAVAPLSGGPVDPSTLPRGVAVELEATQLVRPGTAELVRDVLRQHALPAGLLALDLVGDPGTSGPALRELHRLREGGARLVLAHYGEGPADLRRLLRLPVTALRLGPSLVQALPDARALTLVRSTVELARDLGLEVVADGVVSEAQWAALLAAGCSYGSGRRFGAPTRADGLAVALGTALGRALQQAGGSLPPDPRHPDGPAIDRTGCSHPGGTSQKHWAARVMPAGTAQQATSVADDTTVPSARMPDGPTTLTEEP